jgi:hypothetical protein
MTHCRNSGSVKLAVIAVLCWLSSGFIVWIGVEFATQFIEPRQHGWRELQSADRNVAANWDGVWYQEIARDGYSYDPESAPTVVFFPAYPLLGRGLAAVTGLRISTSLVLVSNVCFLGALILLAKLLHRRGSGAEPGDNDWHSTTLMLVAVLPTGLFFRMAYTESMFLLLVLTAMSGMASGWRLWVIAAVIGLATATRSVRLVLLLPFADHIWRQLNDRPSVAPVLPDSGEVDSAKCCAPQTKSSVIPVKTGIQCDNDTFTLDSRLSGDTRSVSQRSQPLNSDPRSLPLLLKNIATTAVHLLLATWGLLAYSTWLWSTTGDPLAFSHNQTHWVARPERPWTEQTSALLMLEPIWGAYVPSNFAYWQNCDPGADPISSIRAFDPLIFVVAVLLMLIGWQKRWLQRGELLLSIGLIGIPWLIHAYPAVMHSQARYTVVVYPAWIVAGRLISSAGQPLAMFAITVLATILSLWSSLFATWYPFF